MKNKQHLAGLVFGAVIGGCVHVPHAKVLDPVVVQNSRVAAFHVAVANTSEGEHDFIVSMTQSALAQPGGLPGPEGCTGAIELVDHARIGTTSTLRFGVRDLFCGPDRVVTYLEGLKVVYAGDQRLVAMLQPRLGFTQYEFQRKMGTSTRAAYSIEVRFDPDSEVNLGGVITRTDATGVVLFRGIGLEVGGAGEGVVSIVDAEGRRVRAERDSDGRWYVRAQGQSLGRSLEMKIEVESLR